MLINYKILIFISFFFGVGLWLSCYYPFHLSVSLFVLIGLLLVMLALRRREAFLLPFLFFILVLGFSLAHNENISFESRWHPEWEGKWIQVRGKVVSFPTVANNGNRSLVKFEIATEKIKMDSLKETKSHRFLVSAFNPSFVPSRGQTLFVQGKFSIPRAASNPGQFDYRRYLKNQGVHGLLYTFGKKGVYSEKDAAKGTVFFFKEIGFLREALRSHIERDFKDISVRSLVIALILGDRGTVPEIVHDQFVLAGVMHLISISGLHISILAGLFFGFAKLLRFPSYAAVFFTLTGVMGYSLLAGFGIPIIRSLIMGSLYLLSHFFRRERDFFAAISLAFWLLLFYCPTYIYLVGFQLSFMAVLSIVVIMPLYQREKEEFTIPLWLKIMQSVQRFVRDLLGSSAAALIGTVPLLIYHFNLFSTIDLVSNTFAIPLGTIILGLNCLYGMTVLIVPGFQDFLVFLLEQTIHLLLSGIAFLASFPWAALSVPSPQLFPLLLYYVVAALILFLVYRYPSYKRTAFYGLLFLCFSFVAIHLLQASLLKKEKRLEVYFLNCGKAFAASVRFPSGKVWFLNTGGDVRSGQARWAAIPFLRSQGIQKLESLFLLSYGAENWGGFSPFIHYFKPRELWLPDDRALYYQKWAKYLFSNQYPRPQFFNPGKEWQLENGITVRIPSEFSNAKSNAPLQFLYGETEICIFKEKMSSQNVSDERKISNRVWFMESFQKNFFEMQNKIEKLDQRRIYLIYREKINDLEFTKGLAEKGIVVFSLTEKGALRLATDGSEISLSQFR